MPASVIAAVPPGQDARVVRLDVRVRADHRGHAPVEPARERDLLARRLGVEVDDDDLRLGARLLDERVDDLERARRDVEEERAHQVDDGDRRPVARRGDGEAAARAAPRAKFAGRIDALRRVEVAARSPLARQVWLPSVITSAPAARIRSASFGVIPRPSATFSPLTTQKSTPAPRAARAAAPRRRAVRARRRRRRRRGACREECSGCAEVSRLNGDRDVVARRPACTARARAARRPRGRRSRRSSSSRGHRGADRERGVDPQLRDRDDDRRRARRLDVEADAERAAVDDVVA